MNEWIDCNLLQKNAKINNVNLIKMEGNLRVGGFEKLKF